MDAAICISCFQSLKWYSHIAAICEATEEKIKIYTGNKQESTNKHELIELSSINLSCKGNVKYANTFHRIDSKKEDIPDCEEIHIKDEISTQEAEHQDYVTREGPNENLRQNISDSASPVCAAQTKVEASSNLDNLLFKFYKCEICNIRTKYKDHHLLLHKSNEEAPKSNHLVHTDASGVKTYICKICKFTTKSKGSLWNHQLIHLEDSYECKVCNFKTKYKRNFASHQLTHENVANLTLYKCDACTFTTKYKRGLQKHHLTHKRNSGVKMFECKSCDFKSKSKNAVDVHSLIHMKNGPEARLYECDVCSYAAKHKRNLIMHRLIHKDNSEVTMYKCMLCKFQSKFKVSLKRHTLIHKDLSEVEAYSCEKCTFTTKFKDSWRRHHLSHEKNKKRSV